MSIDVNTDLYNKVNRVNELRKDVSDLKYFILTVDPNKNVKRGSGVWDIALKLKINITFCGFVSVCPLHNASILQTNLMGK